MPRNPPKKPGPSKPIASKKASSNGPSRTPVEPGIAAYLDALTHPLKPAVEALRVLVLASDASIGEGVKWNAVSFHAADDFATVNVGAKDRVRLVLHLGAKKQSKVAKGRVADPAGLLEWLAPDRAIATFRSTAEVAEKATALQDVVRAWLSVGG